MVCLCGDLERKREKDILSRKREQFEPHAQEGYMPWYR